MKRILLAVAVLLLAAGVATEVGIRAAEAAPVPPGVHVNGLTYQPGLHVPATQLPRSTPANATPSSETWAGYVDVACRTCQLWSVATAFTLPSVNLNCATTPSASVLYWAGLDGFNDTTTEQIGAGASCPAGTLTYFVWYQMLPQPPVAFTGVNPGDALTVSVSYNGSARNYQLVLVDLTQTGKTLTAKLPCPTGSTCKNKSAEVFTQDPFDTVTKMFVPLADFGQAGFESIAVISRNGLHRSMTPTRLWSTDSISMIGASKNVLVSPSPAYGGQAFVDTWHNSQ
jgi:hypothetical protein